jgi:hypothetical protein
MQEPYEDERVVGWCSLLSKSFNLFVGRPLITGKPTSKVLADKIYNMELVVLSHRFEDVPRFCFANAAAQKLFGYSWDEFDGMDSRLSAKEDAQSDREALLADAHFSGYVDNYSGTRIAKDGSCFQITDVTFWDIYDESCSKVGQAAAFPRPTV